MLLYQILNEYLKLDISAYLNFYSSDDHYTLRGFDSLILKKNFARTSNFKFSFFNRIADTWESLPFRAGSL